MSQSSTAPHPATFFGRPLYRPWAERISGETEDLMIVGHLPFLEKITSFLVCGDERAKAVLFRYSAIVCMEKKQPGKWAVNWILKPEMA